MKKRKYPQLAFWPKHLDDTKFKAWVNVRPKTIVDMYKKGLSQDEIGNKYGVPREEVARVLRLLKLKSTCKKKGHVRRVTGLHKKLPKECHLSNPALGYVLGVYYGDGCGSGGKFSLSVIDRNFAVNTQEHLARLGFKKVEMAITIQRKKGTMLSPHEGKECVTQTQYGFQLYSTKFIEFLSGGARIEYLTPEQKIGFVNGFADSEGSVHKKGTSITISNTDKNLLEYVSRFLYEYGIDNNIRVAHRPRKLISGNTSKTGHVIYIGRIGSYLFTNTFKFSIKRKHDRLMKGKKTFSKSRDGKFVLECIENKELIKSFLKSTKSIIKKT